jgi:hypothetical protein
VGAIANAIVAYAQPLLDQTDGDFDMMNRALTIAQLCWNLAILSEEQRDAAIEEMKPAMNMPDGDFAEFRQQILLPMIRRHHEMFPQNARTFEERLQRVRCRVFSDGELRRNGAERSLSVREWTQIQAVLRTQMICAARRST